MDRKDLECRGLIHRVERGILHVKLPGDHGFSVGHISSLRSLAGHKRRSPTAICSAGRTQFWPQTQAEYPAQDICCSGPNFQASKAQASISFLPLCLMAAG